MLALHHLKIIEADEQPEAQHKDKAGADGKPQVKLAQFAQVVTKLYCAFHPASDSDLGFWGILSTEETSGHKNTPVTVVRKNSQPGNSDPPSNPVRSRMN